MPLNKKHFLGDKLPSCCHEKCSAIICSLKVLRFEYLNFFCILKNVAYFKFF